MSMKVPLKFTIDSDTIIEINQSLITKLVRRQIESAGGDTRPFDQMYGADGADGADVDEPSSLNDQDASADKKVVKSGAKMPSRCWLCKASRLRVVNVGNTGRRILECANRNCLATIEYTDLPVGTIIEQEKATKRNYGWYLRDTSEMVYPTKERLEAFPNPPFEYVPEVLYDSAGRVVIRCPGQRKLVLLQ